MACTPHPSSRRTHRNRLLPRLVAAAAALTVLLLAACGQDVQTNQPYTPAEGVNADVGSNGTLPAVRVRNLMILTREDGRGFLSGTLSATDRDALTGVTGTALSSDGSTGTALTVAFPDPVPLDETTAAVLTDRAEIAVTGTLDPGLTAQLTLTFSNAGQLQIVVPIVDADQAEYASVTPSPAPSSAAAG